MFMRLSLLILAATINCILCYHQHKYSFLPSTINNKPFISIRRLSQNENNNLDYDDFDPRISPHMYSNGVNGGVQNNKSFNSNYSAFWDTNSVNTNHNPSSSDTINDDVDDFDPRISPHMYPNGVNGGVSKNKVNYNSNSVYYDAGTSSSVPYSNIMGDDDDFDPRISPHMYPNGINNGRLQQKQQIHSSIKQKKIGILLIDHGSKREESNLHLERIALAYQQSSQGSNYIVKVAHMEIAEPSIQDGLQMLIDLKVEKIVCHPYFLSPGKHAIKDVPFLLSEAKKNVRNAMNVPIVSTDPLGLHIDLMINVIDKAVQRHLDDDFGAPSPSLNGFFGDIQKQIEEM